MPTALPKTFSALGPYTFLCLNEEGRFLRFAPGSADIATASPVRPEDLPRFLHERNVRREGTTDFFVWVHGWRNDRTQALGTAQRLFGAIEAALRRGNGGDAMVPSFVAVHWPSQSAPTPAGYARVRDRAAKMTEEGDAEFFLASLLGYLDASNPQGAARNTKTLRAAGGYYVHALGHSFGSRFLAAAIGAAARPQARILESSGIGAGGPAQDTIRSHREAVQVHRRHRLLSTDGGSSVGLFRSAFGSG